MRIFTEIKNEPPKFLVCGNLISNDGFLHMKRCFDENVLILVQKGTLYINSNGQNYEIGESQFIIFKAGEEHSGYRCSEGELSYFWMHFNFTGELEILQATESFENKGYVFPEVGTVLNFSRFNILFRQLMDFSLEENLYNKSLLDYLSSVILIELSNQFIEQNKSSGNVNPLVFEVCSWIKQNYTKQFSLGDIAVELGYQAEYISKLFRDEMKQTILQYTNKIRIESSKKLLPNFSVKETAYSCGFDDEKYFMKVFKKQEGLTPTDYKNAFFRKNINRK